MKVLSRDELWPFLEDIPCSVIQLQNLNGQTIVPFPSKSADVEQRKKEIDKFLNSESQPDGVYIVRYGYSRAECQEVKVKKGVVDSEPLQEERPKKKTLDDYNENPTLQQFIDLKIENERLKFENQSLNNLIDSLKSDVDDLKQEIKELEEIEPLEEEESNGSGSIGSFLQEAFPSLVDAYFQNEKEKRENERAKLGLMYKQVEAQNRNVEREQTDEESDNFVVEPTKEGILNFKEKYPEKWEEFYIQNSQVVDSIMND